MKQHYQANLLRTLADDNSILQKNDGVGCCIWCMSGMVFHEAGNDCLIVEELLQGTERMICNFF
jgi:hypothetical protein